MGYGIAKNMSREDVTKDSKHLDPFFENHVCLQNGDASQMLDLFFDWTPKKVTQSLGLKLNMEPH